MKKIKLLFFCMLFIISLSGCISSPDNNVIRREEHNRFISIYLGHNDYIYVDKETKVQYLSVTSGGTGIEVMVDADGKPLLYEGEVE